MFLLICITIALILTGFLFAPIKLKFRFHESEKTIRINYLLARFELDFITFDGGLFVNGWKITRFPIKKEKKTTPKLERKKKKRFGFSGFKLKYIKMAGRLLGHTSINELQIKVQGGFTEPFYTGKIYGYYWMAKGIYPNLMSHVDFRPDFTSGSLAIDSRGYLSMRLIYIVSFLIQIGYELISEKAKNLLTIKERRASYVQ